MKALIIGGTTGLGLGISKELQKRTITELVTIGEKAFNINDRNINHKKINHL